MEGASVDSLDAQLAARINAVERVLDRHDRTRHALRQAQQLPVATRSYVQPAPPRPASIATRPDPPALPSTPAPTSPTHTTARAPLALVTEMTPSADSEGLRRRQACACERWAT